MFILHLRFCAIIIIINIVLYSFIALRLMPINNFSVYVHDWYIFFLS